MMFPLRSICALALVLAAIAPTPFAAAALPSPVGGVFTYRRVFQSSVPEFIEIKISEGSERATYEIRQLDEEPGASPFEVSPALRTKIIGLVSELKYFRGLDLDVHRKIANLGEKTFRWDAGVQSNEVKFNYTLNATATQLLQICEGLARQQELVDLLERRIRYDRLGINDALLQAETDLTKGVLPEPQRLLPLLDQIAADSRFVEIARQRARSLAERVRHSA
jgi:hypothetical protein